MTNKLYHLSTSLEHLAMTPWENVGKPTLRVEIYRLMWK